jgi:lipoprotein-anchoring transpeptidase ErfK/SrfK
MPFYEGQGLHDADWRGSFGGSIYRSNGSHGCVNLPPWAAAEIYNNISAGTAILIYW